MRRSLTDPRLFQCFGVAAPPGPPRQRQPKGKAVHPLKNFGSPAHGLWALIGRLFMRRRAGTRLRTSPPSSVPRALRSDGNPDTEAYKLAFCMHSSDERLSRW